MGQHHPEQSRRGVGELTAHHGAHTSPRARRRRGENRGSRFLPRLRETQRARIRGRLVARRVLLVHGRRGHDPRDVVARAVHAHGHAPAAVDAVQRGRIPKDRIHRHARALHHARAVQAADAGAARRAVWGGARGSNSKLSARAGRVERVGADVVEDQRRRVKGDGGGVGHRGWSSGRATAGGCSRSCLARGSLRT